MKKLLYIGLFLILLGCEENETFFTGPYHVRFTESSDSRLESYSPVIPISVHLVGPQREEDITITYRLEGDAREDVDFMILSDERTVTIPRGQSFGTINLQLINNSNNILESHDVVFVLESVDAPDLEIGFGPGVRAGESYTFTIEDDCILGGSYTGSTEFATVRGIHITSQDCVTYVLENWDIGVFNFSDIRSLTFTDNGDNTLDIPEQEEATLIPEQATIRGNGVVNPVTREIILNIELVDFEGSPIVTINYTPE